MIKKDNEKAVLGLTRRELIRGLGASAAGLALAGTAHGTAMEKSKEHDQEKPVENKATPAVDKEELPSRPDEVEEVLAFISPSYAIPFKVPKV